MYRIHREQNRLRKLRFIEEHNPRMGELLDTYLYLVSDLMNVDYVAVHFVNEEHQEVKASSGISLPHLRREESVCRIAVENASTVVIGDLTGDQRTHNFWYVKQSPFLKSYAAVPLLTEEGYCPGTLCVMDRKRRNFTDAQIQRLMGLGKEVIEKLEQQTRESDLAEKADSREWMIKEIHHRLKNNLAIITGLMDLEWMRAEDEDTRELLVAMQKRVQSIANVHRKLYESDSLEDLNVIEYLQDLIGSIEQSYGEEKRINCIVEGDDFRLNDRKAVTLGLLVNEMVTNSFKHAFNGREEGTIRIGLQNTGESRYQLTVEDDGKGLPTDFDLEQKNSLGFQLIRTLTSQLDADLDLQTDEGTRYLVEFQSE